MLWCFRVGPGDAADRSIMYYYAIQVRTSAEDDFIRRAAFTAAAANGRFFAPKRLLPIKKGGKTIKKLYMVFPGYVFYETDELGDEVRWAIRRLDGFYRFLRSSSSPTPLSEADRRILLHFISFGERADISKVTFDENERIVVLEGALKGLEGQIVKVDRRRGRAKVALDICSEGFLVDLAFTVVEKVTTGGRLPHDGP
jgi:transcriptional antiterminator NusG